MAGYYRQRRSNRDNATLCSAARGGAKEALQPHLVKSAATPSPACVTAAKRYLPKCYKNTQMKGAWARRTILQRARDPPPFCRIWRRPAGLGLCPYRTAKDTPNERRRLHCSGTCSLGPEGGRCPHQRRNLQRRRGSSLKARPGIVITHQIGENCITLPYHGARGACRRFSHATPTLQAPQPWSEPFWERAAARSSHRATAGRPSKYTSASAARDGTWSIAAACSHISTALAQLPAEACALALMNKSCVCRVTM